MTLSHYDIVVIGSGQSGDPLARAFAEAGHSVALIERAHVGGTCANTGCTPTKTMIASARVAYLARRGADFGVQVGGPVTVDFAKVRARKRAIVADFRGGTEKQLGAQDHLELIYGQARFASPTEVVVKTNEGPERTITGGKFFINTGEKDVVPPLPGLDAVPYLDHAKIEELDQVPEHLLILGGGYIALEFGQMFRRFGSRVSIVEKSERLLAHEDQDVSEAMEQILREDGIEVLVGTKALQAGQDGTQVTLTVQPAEGGSRTLAGSHLLVAIGRAPNTEGLGLERAGVETDEQGHIKTNGKLETNVANIWAMGDVKGGPAFTHISYDDYRILQANLLHGGHRSVEDRPVPYTVFTDPQLGRVGMSEQQAKDKGLNYKIAKVPMTQVARTLETDETRGFLKAVVDADSKQILGGAMLCVDGGEVMSVLETAMLGHLPYTVLRDGVFAHPTLSESLNNLFMTLDE